MSHLFNLFKADSFKPLAQPAFMLIASLCLAGLAYADIPIMPNALKSTQPGVKLTLLEFSTPWCISCQVLKPELLKLQKEAGPALKIIELNADEPKNQMYVKRYGVLSTPTIVLFNSSGKAVRKLENDFQPSELRQLVLKQLR